MVKSKQDIDALEPDQARVWGVKLEILASMRGDTRQNSL
jgi:hypothetical protein